MKAFKYTIICLLIFSCNNKKHVEEKPINSIEKVNIDNKDNVFKVSITAKINESDKLQLLYVDDSPEGKYAANKRVQSLVNGEDNLQTVIFELPKDILPYKFRVDLGENGHESPIKIDNIRIELNSNEIFIDSSTIDRYFQKNIYLETEDGMTFFRKKVSGKYDPFLTSSAFLIKKIELEL